MNANELNALARDPDMTPQEAAAFWLMRAQAGDFTAADRAEFKAWLAGGKHRAELYESVRRTWEKAGAAAGAPEVVARREMARSAAGPVRRHRWRTHAAAAAVALAAIASAFIWKIQPSPTRVYETETGERSTISLTDGSTLTLNTQSRALVHFSGGERAVVLERGQALFDVAQDISRPFVVTAGRQRIKALGTAFDVRLDGENVQVTLVEGRVAVEGSPEAMRPGEQFIANSKAPAIVRRIDARRIVSWSQGRIIFENEPLAAAVQEMNRYRRTPIEIKDPSLQDLRVSGVFSAGEPGRFLDALAVTFPVIVTLPGGNSDGVIRLTRRN